MIKTKMEQDKNKEESFKGTKCEVYSRIVGYLRPITQWNEGKQAEWKDRKVFKLSNHIKNEKI